MFFTKSSSVRSGASLLCGVLLSFFSLTLTAQEIDIGEVYVQGGSDVISVLIAADKPELKQAAEKAFGAHGAYRVVRDRSAASFVFTFRSASGNGVNVEISSGSGKFQQTVTGTNSRNALFRAADLAVAKTTGQPGFFAGKLTFIAERTGAKEVYISDLFVDEIKQLTNDRADSVGPRWSPDGGSIVYTSYYRSGFPDIFKIDVGNQRRVPFISVKGTNTGARFSPDGNRVAMVLSGTGNPEVYVSNAAGKQIRRLTHTESVQSSPTWSPDGSRLIFTSDRNGRPQLFTMSVSGGNMSRIPTNISGNCTEPDWNPRHPNLVVFTAAVNGRFALAIYDFSKRKSRFLTKGTSDAVAPCWTNDGRHLIYSVRTATTCTLTLLDTHTGKSTPLSGRNLGKASHADFWIAR